MDDLIGPALPPNFKSKLQENVTDAVDPVSSLNHQTDSEDKSRTRSLQSNEIDPAPKSDMIGPLLPSAHESSTIGPTLLPSSQLDSIGPQLPPLPLETKDNVEHEDDDDNIFGPALPPGFNKQNPEGKKILGPQLPPGFVLQASDDDEDDGDLIGPLPPPVESAEDSKERIARDFEKRSKRMKDKLEGNLEPEKLERETWMTELPPVLQGFGMGPRQFRARPTDIGDRSGWTDTPADKLKKAMGEKSNKEVRNPDGVNVAKRDAEIAEKLKKYEDPERQESLLSMHEKKRKRKLKEDEESGEANIRRPFDREVDMQVNRFDEAARKRMLKQSAGLSSRFSHGETSGNFL